MYFPLIERRIAAKDRRLPSTDRRQAKKIHPVGNNKRTKQARRKGNDRRTLILDRETLRDYAAFLNKAHEHEEKKTKPFLFCSTFLLPLTVAAVSVFATISINKQQVASAEKLAIGQQKNAKLIADAQQENAIKIADGEMETEHLKHMVKIFSSIISPEKKDTQAVIEQRIRSLAVYDNEALPFLLQIRQHFSSLSDSSLGEKDLSAMADKEDRKNATKKENIATATIKTIIRYSQLNVPKQDIEGKSEKDYLNLRNKEYKNYNLENSTFKNVNFYKANFSGSSLQRSTFTNADLVEVNFQHANLAGVIFDNAELTNTDFNQAKLVDVIFIHCKKIENAKFSLNTVLYAKPGFFGKLTEEQYVLLLMSHEEELERINNTEEEKRKLDDILAILNEKYKINSFIELQTKFKQYESKSFLSIKNPENDADQVSMSNLKAYLMWP